MFRRLPYSLPKDPVPPADLEQLGYFLNHDDQIRLIKNPEQKYQYKINRNDRVNDVCRNALNTYIRETVKDRLLGLDLNIVRLPIGSKPNEPHVPIYISKDIASKKRIIVVFGERNQELGIFSYRAIREDGVRTGSAEAFVDAIVNGPKLTLSQDAPGVVITNPGQLIWYRRESRAISYNEYLDLPRSSAVDTPFRVDPIQNRAPGNQSHTEHVEYVFEKVLAEIIDPQAKFDIIGLEYTGDVVIQYLASHWDVWCNRINGICLGNPQFKVKDLTTLIDEPELFISFLAKRTRAYFVSDKPIETPLPGREEHGCNCYASGEELYEDGILIKGWKSMLDWFNMIGFINDYEEPVFKLIEQAEETTENS